MNLLRAEQEVGKRQREQRLDRRDAASGAPSSPRKEAAERQSCFRWMASRGLVALAFDVRSGGRVSRPGFPLSNRKTKAFDCALGPRLRGLAQRFVRGARLRAAQRCALCVADAGAGLLCAACAAALARIGAACPACALPSPDGRRCGACLARPPPWSRAIAALVYAFPADRLLIELKYGGRLALADWAGTTLAAAVDASLAARGPGDRPDCMVALPLSPARQRERGFNQAREIATRVAAARSLRLSAPLVRIRGTVPQAALAWANARRNVRGAFAIAADVRGARIALVDDVLTTGATLAEAACELRRAGAADVECWVVARTLRPGGD